MATGTAAWYGKGIQAVLNKEWDWNTDTIKLALAATAYTPDPDAHDYWNDVSANEVTGTNWAAGGVTLSGCTVDVDATNNRVRLFATDVSVATVTLSDAKHAIIYCDTGGASSTDPLIAYITWDTALAPSAGTLAIDFDGTNGVLRITY